MQEEVQRNEDGTWPEGQSGNPSGSNGHNKGWTRYGDRLQKWLAKSNEEIEAIIADKTQFRKLSSIDVICVKHVAKMMGEEWYARLERECGLDRIEGRAIERVEQTGKDGSPLLNGNAVLTVDERAALVLGIINEARIRAGHQPIDSEGALGAAEGSADSGAEQPG